MYFSFFSPPSLSSIHPTSDLRRDTTILIHFLLQEQRELRGISILDDGVGGGLRRKLKRVANTVREYTDQRDNDREKERDPV
ncbi:Protein CBG27030 [Caenorhabditis briggsae]|uniref:Protein CBG27030 n=1 Tax=Caenorhabditis briggsae TaxID=6238 RepID=B6IM94_CAEBR|nr:Protein CBG27030 [Caenorhabditis briggsae]CAS01024.1 Protein CBG27030 [Caenorhabditis briggsae]